MNLNIYIVMSIYEPVPLASFVNYYELIRFIRKQKFDSNKIYQLIADSYNEFDRVTDVSESVYEHAYNGFTPF